MLTSDQKTQALKMIADAVIESVKAAGKQGAPGGPIYAALMVYGVSFEQFQNLMDALIRIGKLRKSGNLYFWQG